MSDTEPAGTGYLVVPDSGPGPGVLVLSSWWGLATAFTALADRLADEGYSALVPDLLAGARPETSAEAELVLAEADMDRMAGLVVSSVHALRAATAEPRDPIAVLGYSMGASWALWLSARLPESVRAVVACYGTQNIDFEGSTADYQLHVAGDDEVVSADEVVETRAFLGLAGRPVEVFDYPASGHGFCEPHADRYDPEAAELAWSRALAFLDAHRGPA